MKMFRIFFKILKWTTGVFIGLFFSILIYYFKDIFSILNNRNSLIQIFKLIVIGVMPAAAFGLFLPISNLIDESSAILVITALAYIFIASVLYFADKLEEGDKSILDLSLTLYRNQLNSFMSSLS